MFKSYSYELGGRTLTLEFGKYAEQASGAVFVRYGETCILVTATVAETPRPGIDFFPLSVDFEEKLYAVGKIPGGWIRREGRPAEKAILTSRLIDRPLRPLFPKGMRHDVSVVATVMSNVGMERHLQGLGIALVRTPVGDRYVVEHMREHGYNVGGEQSGHVVLSDYSTTGDGLIAALQVLAVLIQSGGRAASEVCQVFAPVPQKLTNVRFAAGSKPLDIASVQEAIRDGEARLNGSGRILIRKSGTEPVIRVMAEGDDEGLVNKVVADIAGAITDAARLETAS